MADEAKQKGNEAFKAQNWDEAIEHYNKAIDIDPNQASFYSNRAACWAQKNAHDKALSDANKCIDLDPKFAKAHGRKGNALYSLGRVDEAEQAYKNGLSVDPANDGCKQGIDNVKSFRNFQNRPGSHQSTGSGGIGGMFGGMFGGSGGAAGFLQKAAQKMQTGGWSGRIQMYMVVWGLYWAYSTYFKGSPSSASDSVDTSRGEQADESSVATTGSFRRHFTEAHGSWMSYLEAGSSAQTQLLMLHRTALSAETEFGKTVPQLVEQAVPTGGLRILAPDRFCHGYTPCPEGGEPHDAAGAFGGLLGKPTSAKVYAYMASGRDAARHAFGMATRRKTPARLLVLRPLMLAGDTTGLTSKLADAEVHRWKLLHEGSDETVAAETLNVDNLPKGCTVTLVYLDGDEEDNDLKAALEAIDITVDVRRIYSLEDGIAPIVADILTGDAHEADSSGADGASDL